MHIRKSQNRNGSISISVANKDASGKILILKSFGSGFTEDKINQLTQKASDWISIKQGKQLSFTFDKSEDVLEEKLLDLFYNSIEKIELVGPEMLFGKIYDQIGFNKIPEPLLKELVISRICYPSSKLKTTEYISLHKGEHIDVSKIYRYLDKFHKKHTEKAQLISYNHSKKIIGGEISVVFYDVTTIYFEAEQPDDLRKTGFSKEGRHQDPQIILGLVSRYGYPIAHCIHEGNKYEGHTLIPIIKSFMKQFNLEKIVVVADSGLLTSTNISDLEAKGYEYIIGARIKSSSKQIKEDILKHDFSNESFDEVIDVDSNKRLIVTYSDKRAKKDRYSRERALEKLEKRIKSGKLTKQNINNRGSNKFLELSGEVEIKIDNSKILKDANWDGLKGYYTNSKLDIDIILEQYHDLWQIEKAFRISKSDLKIRPIYHRKEERIKAHISISFIAYKVYKETERLLKKHNIDLSVIKAIDVSKTLRKISLRTPYSKNIVSRIKIEHENQQKLLDFIDLI